jgi:biopolymer transport protein ExbD
MDFSMGSGRRGLHLQRWNMTPMIDVVFLLLVFFLVSTTQMPPEANLSPGLQAEQEGRVGASDLEMQIIDVKMVDGLPAYVVGELVLRDTASLVVVLRDLPKGPGAFVRCSDAMKTRHAAGAMQACRDAGFERMTYVPAR